jgi:hypothetical protein
MGKKDGMKDRNDRTKMISVKAMNLKKPRRVNG